MVFCRNQISPCGLCENLARRERASAERSVDSVRHRSKSASAGPHVGRERRGTFRMAHSHAHFVDSAGGPACEGESQWTKLFGWEDQPRRPHVVQHVASAAPSAPSPPPLPRGDIAGTAAPDRSSARSRKQDATPGPEASRKRPLEEILKDPRLEKEKAHGIDMVTLTSFLTAVDTAAAKRAKGQPAERLQTWSSRYGWPEKSFTDSSSKRSGNGGGKLKKLVSEAVLGDIYKQV